MAFKRKFWKRGDKLNAKELNRIENGIYEAGNNQETKSNNSFSEMTIINADCQANNNFINITNIDLTVEEFNMLCEQKKPAILKLNMLDTILYTSFVGYISHIDDNEITTAYINAGTICSIGLYLEEGELKWTCSTDTFELNQTEETPTSPSEPI